MPVWLGYHNGPSLYISLCFSFLVYTIRGLGLSKPRGLFYHVERALECQDGAWESEGWTGLAGRWVTGSTLMSMGIRAAPGVLGGMGLIAPPPGFKPSAPGMKRKLPTTASLDLPPPHLSIPTHSPGLRSSFASSRKPPNTADCQIPRGSSKPGLPNPWGSRAENHHCVLCQLESAP